jgi:hypothetical protein
VVAADEHITFEDSGEAGARHSSDCAPRTRESDDTTARSRKIRANATTSY